MAAREQLGHIATINASYLPAFAFKEQDSWGIQTFAPLTNGRGNDWVLLLLDAAVTFPVTAGARLSAAGRASKGPARAR